MTSPSFEPVPPKVSFPDLEQRLLRLWSKERVFERSVEEAKERPRFVFYEGPPTANGMPHPGHVLTRVAKDVILRHRSMLGYYVPRRAGWDTHGLPVEVEVEKALGINGRAAIENYGVEAFTHKCIESVFKYIDEWRKLTTRVAFWVDLDSAYVTFHKSYVESVWWALSELFKKGLLYQDYKIVWWWPQGGTALSAGEVGQGYKTVDDPSVFVRFPIEGRDNTAFLAWTTTPWTLPSHVALAVHREVEYSFCEITEGEGAGETLVVATALIGKALSGREHRVVETKLGAELCGTRYRRPFEYAEPENGAHSVVIDADFVTLDSGSGIVHVAPAFGEDDFKVAKDKELGFLQLVLPDGTFKPEVTEFAGRFCKEADRDIVRDLRQRGLLFKEEVYRHEYPFSWRRDTDPLIQYARRSWFIKTTREISRVIDNNQAVHWEPEHIKDGRFGEFLRSNVDWALSRERFWATPLPIWVNDETGKVACVGSLAEILEKNPSALDHWEAAKAKNPALSEHLVVHKPWIDDVTWTEPGEAGVYRRVPDVIDCWFDSGCMPFAQHGYPHQNKELFDKEFPADFITEAVDQTRGWFYSLITISTLLFEEEKYAHPFRNCTVLGLITDEKGEKLSKSKKNYTDPSEMFERFGADAVRWALYVQGVPGQSSRWFEGGAVDATKEFLLKIWNVYSFFVTYASIDGWTPSAARPPIAERADLDRWILAELDSAVRDVRSSLDGYRTHPASRRLLELLDSISNWYVRRSRSRFWARGEVGTAEAADKASAFATLYEVLVDLSKLIAPFTPFLAEELFQNLVRRHDEGAPISVHLTSYPEPDDARADDVLRRDVDAARAFVSLGGRVRATHKLKVRQPLRSAIVVVADDAERAMVERFKDAIVEELNVEELAFTSEPHTYVDFQVVPNFRALGPKLGKDMPACKKLLGAADGGELVRQLGDKGRIALELPNGTVELTSEEVEIRLTAKEGFAAASDRGRVIVLDLHIDDELRKKGLAREALSKIQAARKAMDLPFEARVVISWRAEGELAEALREHGAWIAGEALALGYAELAAGAQAEGEKHEAEIDSHALSFWLVVTKND